jgi:RNAse (barnase) inhibitor barstar
MKTARIDGATIGSVAELHEALRRGLDLPAHTAPNLDALWDTLTRDLPGPAAVEISGVPALAACSSFWPKLLPSGATLR